MPKLASEPSREQVQVYMSTTVISIFGGQYSVAAMEPGVHHNGTRN